MSRILSMNRGNCPPSNQLLQELCNRFVFSAPEEKRKSFETLLFLVESAHWYYLDNFVAKDPTLKDVGLREFTKLLFNCCNELRPSVGSVDQICNDFTAHKKKIPVAGAIILDDTHERVLLVRGFNSQRWSFPRGKKNKDEEDYACAIREVLEEIGCDIKYHLNKKEYLEFTINEQTARLYIVAGVSQDRPFAPLTNGEISAITWHPIAHLGALESFLVTPFISPLKKWIVNNPSPLARKPNQSLKALCVWSGRLGGKRTKTDERYNRELDIKFGDLTLDQRRALLSRRLVESNNTKHEKGKITLTSRNTKSEDKTITFGSLTFDLSAI